jgi:GNAT superfamily N-acetyltransferase
MEVTSLADRPDLGEAFYAPELDPGPTFAYHDPVGVELWPRLDEDFADYQLALLDDGKVIAKACSIPLRWDGTDEELPDEGWDFALQRGVADFQAGREPNALCALWIVVSSERRGTGLSSRMVQSLRDVAISHDLAVLYAPVAPTRKSDYPLIEMQDYIAWTLADGRVSIRSLAAGPLENRRARTSCLLAVHGRYRHRGGLAGMDRPAHARQRSVRRIPRARAC